jgi:hypothetical protein
MPKVLSIATPGWWTTTMALTVVIGAVAELRAAWSYYRAGKSPSGWEVDAASARHWSRKQR